MSNSSSCMESNLTSACCRTGFPRRYKPAANAGVSECLHWVELNHQALTTLGHEQLFDHWPFSTHNKLQSQNL